MIDFRLMGIDVLPDIIGYIHFGGGLALLLQKASILPEQRTSIYSLCFSLFYRYMNVLLRKAECILALVGSGICSRHSSTDNGIATCARSFHGNKGNGD